MAKKKPTLAQKKALEQLRINAEDWLVQKNCDKGMTLVNRCTGQKKFIPRSLIHE